MGFSDESQGHTIEHVLHWISVSILIIFAIELVTLILAHGACGAHGFFRNPWHVLDFVVVFFSLIADVVLTSYTKGCVAHSGDLANAVEGICNISLVDNHRRMLAGSDTQIEQCESGAIVSLIIIVRFWRVLRIVHAATEMSHKTHHSHKTLKELVHAATKVQTDVMQTLKENDVPKKVQALVLGKFCPDMKDALDMALEELEEDGEDTDKEFYEDVNLLEHDWIFEEVEEEERTNEVESA